MEPIKIIDRKIKIWNTYFMQYGRLPKGITDEMYNDAMYYSVKYHGTEIILDALTKSKKLVTIEDILNNNF